MEAGGECPWCQKRILAAEVEIHHIDEDPSNNSFENLIFTCRNHHGQIGAMLIPRWEVELKKKILCNPSVAERLGLTKKAAPPPPPRVVEGDNYGVAGQTVNIGTVKIGKSSVGRRRNVIPGLIEADPDMRTYANYLVGRYIDWRKKSTPIDKRRFSPGSAHGILGEGFGAPNSVLLIPQARFFAWVKQAQAKIDRTTFGSINRGNGKRNYHTWEDHLAERRGSE